MGLKMRILIAEDEPISCTILRQTLENWGYDVVAAANGIEALEAFQRIHFSFVITDWMMPEMDGLELVRRIRDQQPYDYVYIIMLTARSEKQDLVVGMDAGADDFVAKPFDQEELRVRLRAGERVIQLEEKLALRNAELETMNERLKLDLKTAAEIQRSLLPINMSRLEGINVAWRLRPCEELAGDFLNVFNLDEEEIGLYVLDVSGHGVPAALLAVTLSRLLSPVMDQSSLVKSHSYTPEGYNITSPAGVANQLNKRFQVDTTNGQYFTLQYGLLNKHTRRLRYVSSGHPGMIYMPGDKKAQILNSPSLPIGFMENNEYHENSIQLHPGDRLYLYSDGITEAENSNRVFFGTERMLQTLQKYAYLSLEESLDALMKEVESWTGSLKLKDDATLLAIEIED
jgi:sigma-B regulation protein RsbU (phosphoserine phosphatase)